MFSKFAKLVVKGSAIFWKYSSYWEQKRHYEHADKRTQISCSIKSLNNRQTFKYFSLYEIPVFIHVLSQWFNAQQGYVTCFLANGCRYSE